MPSVEDLGKAFKRDNPGKFDSFDDTTIGMALKRDNPGRFDSFADKGPVVKPPTRDWKQAKKDTEEATRLLAPEEPPSEPGGISKLYGKASEIGAMVGGTYLRMAGSVGAVLPTMGMSAVRWGLTPRRLAERVGILDGRQPVVDDKKPEDWKSRGFSSWSVGMAPMTFPMAAGEAFFQGLRNSGAIGQAANKIADATVNKAFGALQKTPVAELVGKDKLSKIRFDQGGFRATTEQIMDVLEQAEAETFADAEGWNPRHLPFTSRDSKDLAPQGVPGTQYLQIAAQALAFAALGSATGGVRGALAKGLNTMDGMTWLRALPKWNALAKLLPWSTPEALQPIVDSAGWAAVDTISRLSNSKDWRDASFRAKDGAVGITTAAIAGAIFHSPQISRWAIDRTRANHSLMTDQGKATKAARDREQGLSSAPRKVNYERMEMPPEMEEAARAKASEEWRENVIRNQTLFAGEMVADYDRQRAVNEGVSKARKEYWANQLWPSRTEASKALYPDGIYQKVRDDIVGMSQYPEAAERAGQLMDVAADQFRQMGIHPDDFAVHFLYGGYAPDAPPEGHVYSGSYSRFPDGTRLLDITRHERPDTQLHELGHYWHDMMSFIHEKTPSPYHKRQLGEELGNLWKWLGATPVDGKFDYEKLTEKQREKFAEGVTQYLSTGKAPVENVREHLEFFKGFLSDYYQTVQGASPAPVFNEAVTEFFNRRVLGGGASRFGVSVKRPIVLDSAAMDPAARTAALKEIVEQAGAVYDQAMAFEPPSVTRLQPNEIKELVDSRMLRWDQENPNPIIEAQDRAEKTAVAEFNSKHLAMEGALSPQDIEQHRRVVAQEARERGRSLALPQAALHLQRRASFAQELRSQVEMEVGTRNWRARVSEGGQIAREGLRGFNAAHEQAEAAAREHTANFSPEARAAFIEEARAVAREELARVAAERGPGAGPDPSRQKKTAFVTAAARKAAKEFDRRAGVEATATSPVSSLDSFLQGLGEPPLKFTLKPSKPTRRTKTTTSKAVQSKPASEPVPAKSLAEQLTAAAAASSPKNAETLQGRTKAMETALRSMTKDQLWSARTALKNAKNLTHAQSLENEAYLAIIEDVLLEREGVTTKKSTAGQVVEDPEEAARKARVAIESRGAFEKAFKNGLAAAERTEAEGQAGAVALYMQQAASARADFNLRLSAFLQSKPMPDVPVEDRVTVVGAPSEVGPRTLEERLGSVRISPGSWRGMGMVVHMKGPAAERQAAPGAPFSQRAVAPVPVRIVGKPGTKRQVELNYPLLEKLYTEQAWANPRKQPDGSVASRFSPREFSNFEDFAAWMIEREIVKEARPRGRGETIGGHLDSVNRIAMSLLRADTVRARDPLAGIWRMSEADRKTMKRTAEVEFYESLGLEKPEQRERYEKEMASFGDSVAFAEKVVPYEDILEGIKKGDPFWTQGRAKEPIALQRPVIVGTSMVRLSAGAGIPNEFYPNKVRRLPAGFYLVRPNKEARAAIASGAKPGQVLGPWVSERLARFRDLYESWDRSRREFHFRESDPDGQYGSWNDPEGLGAEPNYLNLERLTRNLVREAEGIRWASEAYPGLFGKLPREIDVLAKIVDHGRVENQEFKPVDLGKDLVNPESYDIEGKTDIYRDALQWATDEVNHPAIVKGDGPEVLNARYLEGKATSKEGVYVGRGTKWGNPFPLSSATDRVTVLEQYKDFLRDTPAGQKLVKEAMVELKGKKLICWCAPEACHADVLLEVANEGKVPERAPAAQRSFQSELSILRTLSRPKLKKEQQQKLQELAGRIEKMNREAAFLQQYQDEVRERAKYRGNMEMSPANTEEIISSTAKAMEHLRVATSMDMRRFAAVSGKAAFDPEMYRKSLAKEQAVPAALSAVIHEDGTVVGLGDEELSAAQREFAHLQENRRLRSEAAITEALEASPELSPDVDVIEAALQRSRTGYFPDELISNLQGSVVNQKHTIAAFEVLALDRAIREVRKNLAIMKGWLGNDRQRWSKGTDRMILTEAITETDIKEVMAKGEPIEQVADRHPSKPEVRGIFEFEREMFQLAPEFEKALKRLAAFEGAHLTDARTLVEKARQKMVDFSYIPEEQGGKWPRSKSAEEIEALNVQPDFSREGAGLDILQAKDTSRYFEQDVLQAKAATRFIGRGSPESSTEAYRKVLGDKANAGDYVQSDVVWVRAEGNRKTRVPPDFGEIQKALDAHATILTLPPGTEGKSSRNTRASSYEVGSKEIAKYLEEHGYHEDEPGIWLPNPKATAGQLINLTPNRDYRSQPTEGGEYGQTMSDRMREAELHVRARPRSTSSPTMEEVTRTLDAGTGFQYEGETFFAQKQHESVTVWKWAQDMLGSFAKNVQRAFWPMKMLKDPQIYSVAREWEGIRNELLSVRLPGLTRAIKEKYTEAERNIAAFNMDSRGRDLVAELNNENTLGLTRLMSEQFFGPMFREAVKTGLFRPDQVIEDYVNRLYFHRDRKEALRIFRERAVDATNPHSLERMFESIVTARENGLVPWTNDIALLAEAYGKSIIETMTHAGMVRDFQNVAPASIQWALPEKKPAGMVEMKTQNPRDFMAIDPSLGRAAKVLDRDGQVKKEHLYATKELATLLDNYIQRSWWDGGTLRKGVKNANSYYKHVLLMFDVYHWFQLMRANATMTLFVNPSKENIQKNLGKEGGFGFSAWKEGFAMLDPEHMEHAEVSKLIRQGLNLSKGREDMGRQALDAMYDRTFKVFGKDINAKELQTKLIEAREKTKVLAFNKWDEYLWPKVHSGLKVVHAMQTFKRLLHENPHVDPDILRERAVTITNDAFGGISWAKHGRSKSMEDSLRMMVLAPDWLESRFRLLAGIYEPKSEQVASRIEDRPRETTVTGWAGAVASGGNKLMEGVKRTMRPLPGTVVNEHLRYSAGNLIASMALTYALNSVIKSIWPNMADKKETQGMKEFFHLGLPLTDDPRQPTVYDTSGPLGYVTQFYTKPWASINNRQAYLLGTLFQELKGSDSAGKPFRSEAGVDDLKFLFGADPAGFFGTRADTWGKLMPFQMPMAFKTMSNERDPNMTASQKFMAWLEGAAARSVFHKVPAWPYRLEAEGKRLEFRAKEAARALQKGDPMAREMLDDVVHDTEIWRDACAEAGDNGRIIYENNVKRGILGRFRMKAPGARKN